MQWRASLFVKKIQLGDSHLLNKMQWEMQWEASPSQKKMQQETSSLLKQMQWKDFSHPTENAIKSIFPPGANAMKRFFLLNPNAVARRRGSPS